MAARSEIVVGGLVPFTTIDYPHNISMVVFLQGCPWRCVYCSNPHLFAARAHAERDSENWGYILDLLSRRTRVLDAVVFSGGEATAQPEGMIAAIADIRTISPRYKIGLHTNGCFPENLASLLPHVDWVGLDIKAPAEKYDAITKVAGSAKPAFESLGLLLASRKPFEVRTTADPSVLSKADILSLARTLSETGVENYALQRYRPVDKESPSNPPMPEIMQFFADKDFEAALRPLFASFELRF